MNRGVAYLKAAAEEYIGAYQSNRVQCHPKKTTSTKKVVRTDRGRAHASGAKKRDIILLWPINSKKFWLSSYFGWRKSAAHGKKFHYGIDMAALRGTPVYAAAPGVVREAGMMTGYGNTVLVSHGDKYSTRYAHLHTIKVKAGQRVQRGQYIGTVGDSGRVRKMGKDASHLHFEVSEYGKRINPMRLLP